jgi:hypothetical protein
VDCIPLATEHLERGEQEVDPLVLLHAAGIDEELFAVGPETLFKLPVNLPVFQPELVKLGHILNHYHLFVRVASCPELGTAEFGLGNNPVCAALNPALECGKRPDKP